MHKKITRLFIWACSLRGIKTYSLDHRRSDEIAKFKYRYSPIPIIIYQENKRRRFRVQAGPSLYHKTHSAA